MSLLVTLSAHAMPSADLWWQLSGGREMVDSLHFPRRDQYSFSAPGELWLNHEWLAECLMYLVYKWFGVGGLHLGKLLLLAGAFLLVAVVGARDGCRPWALALACSVALLNSEWRSFQDVRPYLLTYLMLGATWAVADGALRTGRWRSLVWLLPIFVVWANVHSGVVAGLGLLGVVALAEWQQGGKVLAAFAVGCAAAACVNPYGWEVVTYPFQFIGRQDDWTRFLNEWARPQWTGAHASFTVFVLVTAAAWGVGRRRFPLRHVWVLAAFLVLSSRAWRNLPLFALVSVPVWAACFETCLDTLGSRFGWNGGVGRGLGGGSHRAWALTTCGASVASLLLGASWCGWVLARTDWSSLSMEREMFPAVATRFLEANSLPRRLLNPYGWGGYLSFHLWPRYLVFMDGRASTVYPERVYHDFLVATQGVEAGSRGAWEEVLGRYGVHVVVVNRWETAHMPDSIGRVLPGSRVWMCVYADAVAKVYVDSSPEGLDVQGRAARGELAVPEGARTLMDWPVDALLEDAEEALARGQFGEARELVKCACAREPGRASSWFLAAVLSVRTGDVGRGEELTRKALAIDPSLPHAHYNLAVLLRMRGDLEGARREVEMELKVNPRSVAAQDLLHDLRRRD